MLRFLIGLGLCGLLAGTAVASTIVVAGPAAGESRVIGMIQVNNLDAGYLAQLLGGGAVSFSPDLQQRSRGYGYLTPGTRIGVVSNLAAPTTTTLDPNAPLANFVPYGVDTIVGLP